MMKKLLLLLAVAAGLCQCNKSIPTPPDPPAPPEASITISAPSLTFEVSGGSQSIQVTCPADYTWTLSGDVPWCLPSIKSGSNGASVTFVAETNTALSGREASFTFSCQNASVQLTVSQKQNDILTVDVPQAGQLSAVITQMGLKADQIASIKITGTLNADDCLFMNQSMQALRDLDMSEVNMTVIPFAAFYDTRLESVKLPNTLITIETHAFSASKLKTITIPASVETIGNGAFHSCPLKTVIFEPNSKLKTIGEETADAGGGAFSQTPITSITIPASVTSINQAAFLSCSSLTNVTFAPNSELKTIGNSVFLYSSVESINFPASLEVIKFEAFCYCDKLTSVTFAPDSKLKTIEHNAFHGCNSLKSVNIPANVETIDPGAFINCQALETVIFEPGSKIKSIRGSAWALCSSLKYIDLPNNVEVMGERTFMNCSALESIAIPASLKTIGVATFENCTSLTNVTFNSGSMLQTIERYAFVGCTNLNTFDAESCVDLTAVGNNAFKDTPGLRLVKLGATAPPTASFESISPDAVLKVPATSINAYKQAEGWKMFTTIKGLNE